MPAFTPKQLAAQFRRAAAAVFPAIVAAEKQTATEAEAAGVHLSSGPHSTAQLRAAGHPYSRQRPNSAYDAAIVNMQTGAFAAAWRPVPPSVSGSRVICGAVNRDAAARYMAGTRFMVARPVAAAVQKSVQPKRVIRLRKAIAKVLAA